MQQRRVFLLTCVDYLLYIRGCTSGRYAYTQSHGQEMKKLGCFCRFIYYLKSGKYFDIISILKEIGIKQILSAH